MTGADSSSGKPEHRLTVRELAGQILRLASLPADIDAQLALLPTDYEPVFLHRDIHAGNVLLMEVDGCWQIGGLIDFGDSLCGFNEYAVRCAWCANGAG